MHPDKAARPTDGHSDLHVGTGRPLKGGEPDGLQDAVPVIDPAYWALLSSEAFVKTVEEIMDRHVFHRGPIMPF